MSNNFEVPEPEEGHVNCQVIGIKQGSPVREILFESTNYTEFLKAYKHYYQSGKYVMVLKQYDNKVGGIK